MPLTQSYYEPGNVLRTFQTLTLLITHQPHHCTLLLPNAGARATLQCPGGWQAPCHMEHPHWPGQLGDDWNLFLGLSKRQKLRWEGSTLSQILLSKCFRKLFGLWQQLHSRNGAGRLASTSLQSLLNLQREGKNRFLKSQVMPVG